MAAEARTESGSSRRNAISRPNETQMISSNRRQFKESGNDIIFQGYLQKQSLYLKQFKKSWIILNKDGKLYCYKSESMKSKPTEIIDIVQFESIKANNKNLFTLYDPSKNVNKHKRFKSADESMITLWVEMISPIIKTKNGKLTNDDPPKYIHNIQQQQITCPNMLKSGSKNPLNCHVYMDMIEKYQCNQKNLNHLLQFQHFENEYENKPKCEYGDSCKGYSSYVEGVDQNKIEYKCHMKLYNHPPRTQRIKLSQNIHSLILNKSKHENHPLYEQTADDVKFCVSLYKRHKLKDIKHDGLVPLLIHEVIQNGFKHDLCTNCRQNDDCKHDVYDKKNKYSILQIVDEKLQCERHKIIGSPLTRCQMLALVLYTGLLYIVHASCCLSALQITQAATAIMICVVVKGTKTMLNGNGSITVYFRR